MSVFKPVLAEIDERDALQLVEDREREGLAVEFKRDMYGNADAQKKEFLKDISSFANSNGGHLIVGVEEAEGVATGISPIIGNSDEALQRLEQMARTGIEPRIVGIQMRALQMEGGAFVYIIRVPKSWNPPHRVSYQNSNRFYLRSSAGVHEASVDELRAIFANGAGMRERIKARINERVRSLELNEGVVPLAQGAGAEGKLVLHVLPFSAFTSNDSIDVAAASAQDTSQLLQPLGSNGNPRINFDGFMNVRPAEVPHGYTQVFRNGIVEATKVRVIAADEGDRVIPCRPLVENLYQRVPSYVRALQRLEVAPPFGVSISLIDVEGAILRTGAPFEAEFQHAIDRQTLVLPMQNISDFGSDAEYLAALSPAFDALWNAVGLPSAQEFLANFDVNGAWVGA